MSNIIIEKDLARQGKIQALGEAKEDQLDVGIFRVVDRMGSGFIRIGTERQPSPDEIEVAGVRRIKNTSAFWRINGKTKQRERVAIRYLASTPEIEVKKQEAEGAVINPNEDIILIKNGEIVVVGDGKTEGLLKYFRRMSENGTLNDDGSEREGRYLTAPSLIIEVFPEKENEEFNDNVFILGEAIGYLDKYRTKGTVGKVEYDEYGLKALAKLHNVVAETPGGIMKGLVAAATANPDAFLKRSREFEDETMTDILHAEKLGVIMFEKTRVVYVEKDKVLVAVNEKLTEDAKRKLLAGYFMSPEGAFAYREFQTELNLKKNQNIS